MGLKTSSGMVRGEERSVKNPPQGLPRIMNLLQFLVEVIGLKRIAEPVKIPLEGLKLAAYYGCLTTRPRKVAEFDDPEQPVSMDRILNTLGAETVLWSHKTECCGGPFITSEVSIALDLSRQVLEAARHSGAEAIVVACPMCQLSLDSRQVVVRRDQVLQPRLPIIYFTQLIALAYGFPIRHTGLKSLLINPLTLLAKKGLA
jgi:heterodisulfide reductase subunit B